jgi:Stage II sporulation protein E (SpoIIE)
MARCIRCAMLLVLSLPLLGKAQTSFAKAPASAAATTAAIVLGDSDIPLYGPWKFHTGDSPINPATGAPLWAEPEFDDSSWESVSLRPQPGLSDPYTGDPRYIPGWTTKGHPGYMGYAWYRLRVAVTAKAGSNLALAAPIYVDDAFQAFANGKLLGGYGRFDRSGKLPVAAPTGPAMLNLPESVDRGGTGRPYVQVIAFRVWMGPMGLTHSQYAGGIHYAPRLGLAAPIAARTRLDQLELALHNSFAPFEAMMLFLLGVVTLSLVLFDRSDRVYYWVAGVLFFTAFADVALTAYTLTRVLSSRTYFMFFDVFSNPLELCGWIMVWWHWFHLRRPSWMPKAILSLMLIYMVTKAIGGDFFYGMSLQPPAAGFNVVSVLVRLVFLPLFIYVIVLGIRQQGPEGWLVLPAVVPLIISQFASELIVLNLPVKWSPFGITIFVGQVANIVSATAISLLLLRRLLLSVRRQKLMALDVRQAQEVQQVIVPEALTSLPGFAIESEFQPAQQVAGDFFQVIPHPSDGSLLIVVGDVNGKGLRAGMLVALLVGTIRSIAQFDTRPATMLNALNQRLMGRGNSIATCMALHIASNGDVVLANAGHVPPYLNGDPLAVEGTLPLGLLDKPEFSSLRFHLNPGDRLVLMTDGIAEATNANGQLFGFERVRELLHSARSAREIVGVACAFGQIDDISLVSVSRAAAS